MLKLTQLVLCWLGISVNKLISVLEDGAVFGGLRRANFIMLIFFFPYLCLLEGRNLQFVVCFEVWYLIHWSTTSDCVKCVSIAIVLLIPNFGCNSTPAAPVIEK